MVIIGEIKKSAIDTSITFARYVEGPDKFDEWYALVRQKYPNATRIHCANNKLTSISCPDATEINCGGNKLISIYCPDVIKLYCNDNKLTSISCPNATQINCQDNNLTELYCPSATKIWCFNNPNLRLIDAPNLEYLSYDPNINIMIPLELDNPTICDKKKNGLNYEEIVEQLIASRQSTKSARKI
jgi:hypothetical protein